MMRAAGRQLMFRPASADDAVFAADLMTALRPHSPTDPVSLRYWWSQTDEYMESARFLALDGDRPVGFGHTEHARWGVKPERYGVVGGDLLPAERTRATLDLLLDGMERRIVDDGARILRGYASLDDPLRIETILARGYTEDRRTRRWELDLVANRDRVLAMTQESRARMRREGVRLLTLSEEPDEAAAIEQVWRLSVEAVDDVPTTVPHPPESMASYVRWVNAPEIHRDRFWLARRGDELVGLSVLGYPPVRGIVGTNWTATARSARGLGIARALKCETLAQAIALGVDRVRTGNDAANAPILHINETMGYRQVAGGISFLRNV